MSSLRNMFRNVMIKYDNFEHHGDLNGEWKQPPIFFKLEKMSLSLINDRHMADTSSCRHCVR